MEREVIIKKFNKYLDNHSKELSKNTISSYMLDITKLLKHLEDKDIVEFIVDETNIENYITILRQENYSESTISRVFSAFNMFNNFLYDEKIINQKVRLDNKAKKVNSTKDLVIFTREEINAILNFTGDSFLDLRDKAIFELVYAIGIKPSDCIMLTTKDINLEIGYIKYKSGKGTYNTVPLNSETVNALNNYLKALNTFETKKDDSLFISTSGERLTRQGFWKIFKRRQKNINLNKELNPTTYRNSLAIHLLEDGISVEDVREILGLKTINSLKVYIDNINNSKKVKLLTKHPRNMLK
ncbi:tyrosine-type recombinase/integrase [Gemella sp. GH3]|uniref:tyrosine-type recombinase/integrase n=1 Tax=unclassified Gemella TaxID=2624949 RepID=UPI0015CF9639|nr:MULTISPECIES: tyrosine-type recombinase/integrase [unclassified Gemella]MBF0714396.1 tyrosine-type recombinase/integrase [Gemella sp. GH3.1]NYS51348.1 tyrosine-type recombinase/integrase [Gemella sp. GH3]